MTSQAGYYCDLTTGDQFECGGVDVYCPEDSVVPSPVLAGSYSLGGTSITTRTATQLCEPGYHCRGGIKYECGTSTEGRCAGGISCWCEFYGQSGPIPVSNGYFSSDGGVNTRTRQLPCQLGWYCPGDGTNATCVPGKYANQARMAACALCEAGKYVDGFGATTCADCDDGAACPPGSTSKDAPCPDGYVSEGGQCIRYVY